MNYNPDILKDTQKTCQEALNYLKEKDKLIQLSVEELNQLDDQIKHQESIGMDVNGEKEIFNAKEQELYNLEFDVKGIMKEQSFMDQLMFDIRDIMNIDFLRFGDSKDHKEKIIKDKEKIKVKIAKLEERVKKIPEGNKVKDDLRLKIIDLEDFNNKLDKLLVKIDNRFENSLKLEKEIDDQISKINIEKEDILSDIDKKEIVLKQTYYIHDNTHKDFVEEKINFNSRKKENEELQSLVETYGIGDDQLFESNKELEKIHKELHRKMDADNDSGNDYEELIQQINELKTKLREKETEISNLNDEKEWLLNQSELKDKQIEKLELKLKVWEDSYAEFEKLVNDLAIFVGYNKPYVNANGEQEFNVPEIQDVDDIKNPLAKLIRRLEEITKFVQEQPLDEIIVEEKTPVSPLLVAGAAIGAISILSNFK